MTPKDLRRIASSTEDAYSYYRYADWLGCVKALANMGFGPRAIAVILRSKVTRWAADAADSDSNVPASALVDFCQKNGYIVGSKLVNDLLENDPVADPVISTLIKK